MEYSKKIIVDYYNKESAKSHYYDTMDQWIVWYHEELENNRADAQRIFFPYVYTSPTVAEVLIKDHDQAERFIAHHQTLVEEIGHPVSCVVVDYYSDSDDFVEQDPGLPPPELAE